jgi:polygalacturonase
LGNEKVASYGLRVETSAAFARNPQPATRKSKPITLYLGQANMKQNIFRRIGLILILGLLGGCQSANGVFEVRNFGAHGDGKHLDTPAVNDAIAAAAKAGGGEVHFSAGTYLCYSIHLQSNIILYLDYGAKIKAAGTTEKGEYDPPEPFPFADQYQDFGHTHWHNSLIWGENIENVAIMGPGMIDGKDALNRGSPKPPTPKAGWPKIDPTTQPWQDTTQPSSDTVEPWDVMVSPDDIEPGPATDTGEDESHKPWRWATQRFPQDIDSQDLAAMYAATQPTDPTTKPTTRPEYPDEKETLAPGIGNKAISLKNVRGCILRDFSIFEGGHFGILATAVDGLTIDNVKIDTNRDGMDIDCCRNVRVSNCAVNSPNDDAIVLKSSYGLGYTRDTENVTITNCMVSGGYEEGTMLDGTFKRIGPWYNYDKKTGKKRHTSRTGRIKFGTESNGGFKNIAISNCLFDDCQGLAIESVDGGVIDNVTISNLAMRDLTSSPLYIRLGARLRGPAGTPVGAIRHVTISDVMAQCKSVRYACVISGIPGDRIEDLHLHNITLIFPGGGSGSWTRREPFEQVKGYPDPSRFGGEPSYGFYIRHVSGLEMTNVEMSIKDPDQRPPFFLRDVQHLYLGHVTAMPGERTPMFEMDGVQDFTAQKVSGMPDEHLDSVGQQNF